MLALDAKLDDKEDVRLNIREVVPELMGNGCELGALAVEKFVVLGALAVEKRMVLLAGYGPLLGIMTATANGVHQSKKSTICFASAAQLP